MKPTRIILTSGLVGGWMLSGLTACGDEGVHPSGFAKASRHGPELLLQKQDCRTCHGSDLTGVGDAVSCDSCHSDVEPQAWRTDCTFCHGGQNNATGAPPSNLDGGNEVLPNFPDHDAHVTAGKAAAFDCIQCHVKAADVLGVGHAFDDTPAAVEVDMGGGISAAGVYDGNGTCSNTYCHGDGRADNGTIQADAGAQGCTSCHPGLASAAAEHSEMSGLHALHLGVGGASCEECHSQVTNDGASIASPSLHVNGQRNVSFVAAGFTFDAASQGCSGTCHGNNHNNVIWQQANGQFHPLNWAAAANHGPDMELQRMDCRVCHGADLTGGVSAGIPARSCDDCHDQNQPQAWRTDCTFCHGGGVNNSGAPPQDLGAANNAVSQSFVAHTVHVTQGKSAAYGCSQCHRSPANVLDQYHAFDDTPGYAEVYFSGGLSAQGVYNNGTCSNLYCHGNGQGDNGTYYDGGAPLGCGGCHPSINNANLWVLMGGDHNLHLQQGDITCSDCHYTVTQNNAESSILCCMWTVKSKWCL